MTALSPQAMMAMGFRQGAQPTRPMPQGSDPLLDLYIMNPALFREGIPNRMASDTEGGAARINQLHGEDILSDAEIEAAQRLWAESQPPSKVQQFMDWISSIGPKVP